MDKETLIGIKGLFPIVLREDKSNLKWKIKGILLWMEGAIKSMKYHC